jgi:Na+/phosphate symporter
MRKLPNIQLSQSVPFALAIVAVGFCLMQTDDWENIGAIVFSLGLLPIAVMISRTSGNPPYL